ncbi:MAG: hypothetical protein ACW98X_26150, partial [Promethearchaeota archaeon]
ARKQNVKLISAEKGSLNQLRANLAKLTTQRNAVNTSTKEGAKEFKRLNKAIKEQNDSIKEAEAAGGDFRRNVGNYTSAIGDAIPALRALNLTMLANPVGLVVAAFAALIAAFSKTEKGAKVLKTALAIINVVFDTLVGYVGDFAVSIYDAFSNPVDSIKEFANLVQNYVLEKVDALIDMFGFLGDVIKKVFEGDFEGAVDSAKKAGDAFLNANPYVDLFEATSEAVKDVTEKIVENVKETVKLEDASWRLQRSMLAVQKEISKLEGQEAVLASRSEDATLSFQEQAKAQEELIQVQRKKSGLQEKLIKDELAIIQSRYNIAKRNGEDTLVLQQELTEKQKELTAVRNQALLDETENLKVTRQRNQDIWEQELDFIIDVGEKEREILLKRAEDETLTIEQRKQALKDYESAYAQFLSAQRKQFDEIGLDDEELNRLLGIKDPAELAQAITDLEGLTEVEKNRLREVLIEFKNSEMEKVEAVKDAEKSITETTKKEADKRKKIQQQVNDAKEDLLQSSFNLAKTLAGENTELVKAIGLVEVGVNTARGVMQAFATLPTPAAFPAAAAIVATGAAQAISITRASSSGAVNSVPTGTGVAPNTSAADQNAQQTAALQQAIENIGLTISVSEINDVQNNVQVQQQTASI